MNLFFKKNSTKKKNNFLKKKIIFKKNLLFKKNINFLIKKYNTKIKNKKIIIYINKLNFFKKYFFKNINKFKFIYFFFLRNRVKFYKYFPIIFFKKTKFTRNINNILYKNKLIKLLPYYLDSHCLFFKIKYNNKLYIHSLTNRFNILNKLFLSKFTLEYFKIRSFDMSFNKKSSLINNNTKTFYLNMWKQQILVFKGSRDVHWRHYFIKKTIKKKRYKNFLNKFFSKNSNNCYNTVLSYISFFNFKFNFSFKFWESFINYYSYLFNSHLESNNFIFQFIISKNFLLVFDFFFYYKKKQTIKCYNWVYKSHKNSSIFWMKKKQHLPKLFNKMVYNIFNSKNNIQFDFCTGYFSIFNNINKTSNIFIFNKNDIINKNYYLKLNVFRYKVY